MQVGAANMWVETQVSPAVDTHTVLLPPHAGSGNSSLKGHIPLTCSMLPAEEWRCWIHDRSPAAAG